MWTLLLIFVLGALCYTAAVAWCAFCYWGGQPKACRLSALPGPFGALLMIAAVLSALNDKGLLKNLPEALMGFLSFVVILLVGIPLPWLLGLALGSLIRQVRPPRKPPRRRGR